MDLGPRKPSEEEERPEQEAEHDRYSAAVLFHPRSQGAEHVRGPLRDQRIEADEHENRDGEDHEHQPERRDAAFEGSRLDAMISSMQATKIARFLIWSGKSAIPKPNALVGDMAFIDSIHLGGCASGSGAFRRLLMPRTMRRAPTATPMTRPAVETALPAPPKRASPAIPIAAQVVKYPSASAIALGRGLSEPKEQDGEEEQGWGDRTTNGQDDELWEKGAHEPFDAP